MNFIEKEELLYLLYHLPISMSTPFISWYFFNLSGDFIGSGLIISIPFIAFIFSTTIFGRLSDRFGSKNLILIALFTQTISFLVYYLINEAWIFFFCYIGFNVIISAFVPAYNRYVTFHMNRDRGEVFGRLAMWASLGFFVGSVLTAILLVGRENDFRPLFIFAALFSLFAFSSSFFLDKGKDEIFSSNTRVDGHFQSKKSVRSLIESVSPIFVLLSLIYITQTSNSLYVGLFAIFIEHELGEPVNWVAIINAVATIIGIATTFLIGKLISKGYPKKRILMIGLIIYFLLPSLTFIFSNDSLIVFLLYSIPAYSTFFVVAPVIISEITDDDKRGFSMGLFSASMYFGQATGTLMGAIVADYTGIIRNNFLIGGFVAFSGLIIGRIFFKENSKKQFIVEKINE
ncbi:MAG: MFS transporter [Candidatus Hodarchaeales archaeon]